MSNINAKLLKIIETIRLNLNYELKESSLKELIKNDFAKQNQIIFEVAYHLMKYGLSQHFVYKAEAHTSEKVKGLTATQAILKLSHYEEFCPYLVENKVLSLSYQENFKQTPENNHYLSGSVKVINYPTMDNELVATFKLSADFNLKNLVEEYLTEEEMLEKFDVRTLHRLFEEELFGGLPF